MNDSLRAFGSSFSLNFRPSFLAAMTMVPSNTLTINVINNTIYVTIGRYPNKGDAGTIRYPDLWGGNGNWCDRTVRKTLVREPRPLSLSRKASPSSETVKNFALGVGLIYGCVQDRSPLWIVTGVHEDVVGVGDRDESAKINLPTPVAVTITRKESIWPSCHHDPLGS